MMTTEAITPVVAATPASDPTVSRGERRLVRGW